MCHCSEIVIKNVSKLIGGLAYGIPIVPSDTWGEGELNDERTMYIYNCTTTKPFCSKYGRNDPSRPTALIMADVRNDI